MAHDFREQFVYPWRVSAREALQRAQERGDLRLDDIDFALDLIVGTVLQRTLVVREPAVEGLKANLLGVVLRTGGHSG